MSNMESEPNVPEDEITQPIIMEDKSDSWRTVKESLNPGELDIQAPDFDEYLLFHGLEDSDDTSGKSED